MEQPVITALIGAASAIAGALVAAVATWRGARLKLRELELTYHHKLEEKYLENARQYINGLYVPLSLALSVLAQRNRLFRRFTGDPVHSVPAAEEASFRSAIEEYLATVEGFRQRGADAFLTSRLDEELSNFNAFLEASLTATEPVIRMVYEYRIGLADVALEKAGSALLTGWSRRLWSSPSVSLNFLGGYLTYSADELLAAPPASNQFAKRMAGNIPALKALIKEVTLGARGPGS